MLGQRIRCQLTALPLGSTCNRDDRLSVGRAGRDHADELKDGFLVAIRTDFDPRVAVLKSRPFQPLTKLRLTSKQDQEVAPQFDYLLAWLDCNEHSV